jgi:hypothetical protein
MWSPKFWAWFETFGNLKQWVWNGIHSDLVRINEELLERKVAAPV